MAREVVAVGGLDTRLRHRHHFQVNVSGELRTVLGADDLRLEYDMSALTHSGHAAQGLVLVVLGTQEGTPGSTGDPGPPAVAPSSEAVQAYFTMLSGATATFNPIALPNPNNDLDEAGSNREYESDVEMQSVGAPNAASIDLVLSPASEVFETGAQYIVNQLPSAVVVSTSLGTCEPEEITEGGGLPSVATSEPASAPPFASEASAMTLNEPLPPTSKAALRKSPVRNALSALTRPLTALSRSTLTAARTA